MTGQRVLVLGTSCSGKSTTARLIGQKRDIPDFDLDEFNWLPGWRERPVGEFSANVQKMLDENTSWVFCGSYSKLGGIVQNAADTVIWLDYSFARVLWQFVKRTYRRTILKEPCCNGNFETLGRVFSKDSLFLWILKTYSKRRREYPAKMEEFKVQGKTIYIFKNPRELADYLDLL